MITESDIEFLRTVWNRRPFFTYVFFGFNIAIFVLMTLAGGTTNGPTLEAFGVKVNDLINRGEYWRFVTPVSIHIGFLHLLFNSYALWIVGPQVEKLYGAARFLLLYVAAGVAGVAGSYFYRPDMPSAGASGAIFGLFGVLLVFGIRYRHNIPPFFRRAVGTGVLPVIVINLIIGFSVPQIDNSAHIAGLLAGMALAAVVPYERPRTQTPAVFTAIQYVLLGLIAVCWIQVARHYDGPRLAFQNVYKGFSLGLGSRSTTGEFVDAMNDTQNAFAASVDALRSNQKRELAASIKDVAGAIDELKGIPSLSASSDRIASQLLELLENQYELLQEANRADTVTLMQERQVLQNQRRFRELDEAFDAWVTEEGGRHGIQLRKPQ